MTEITPILPVQIVSNYTRTYPTGDTTTTAIVKYSKVGDGAVTVSEMTYTTYNARGEAVEQYESPRELGKLVDISA